MHFAKTNFRPPFPSKTLWISPVCSYSKKWWCKCNCNCCRNWPQRRNCNKQSVCGIVALFFCPPSPSPYQRTPLQSTTASRWWRQCRQHIGQYNATWPPATAASPPQTPSFRNPRLPLDKHCALRGSPSTILVNWMTPRTAKRATRTSTHTHTHAERDDGITTTNSSGWSTAWPLMDASDRSIADAMAINCCVSRAPPEAASTRVEIGQKFNIFACVQSEREQKGSRREAEEGHPPQPEARPDPLPPLRWPFWRIFR